MAEAGPKPVNFVGLKGCDLAICMCRCGCSLKLLDVLGFDDFDGLNMVFLRVYLSYSATVLLDGTG